MINIILNKKKRIKMVKNEIEFLHFWDPDWCPFKNTCKPKVITLKKDLCFGTSDGFRFCINLDLDTFNTFLNNHDPEKSAIVFMELSRKELTVLKQMIEDALKFSTGVDDNEEVDEIEGTWKNPTKPAIVKKDPIY
jgi:hypothetical protein